MTGLVSGGPDPSGGAGEQRELLARLRAVVEAKRRGDRDAAGGAGGRAGTAPPDGAAAYWHTQATLARWCRIRSYLDSAAAHALTALEAVTAALAGKPWLPLPAIHATA